VLCAYHSVNIFLAMMLHVNKCVSLDDNEKLIRHPLFLCSEEFIHFSILSLNNRLEKHNIDMKNFKVFVFYKQFIRQNPKY
jgi:hypothetical protein